jgi:hypothetical protein
MLRADCDLASAACLQTTTAEDITNACQDLHSILDCVFTGEALIILHSKQVAEVCEALEAVNSVELKQVYRCREAIDSWINKTKQNGIGEQNPEALLSKMQSVIAIYNSYDDDDNKKISPEKQKDIMASVYLKCTNPVIYSSLKVLKQNSPDDYEALTWTDFTAFTIRLWSEWKEDQPANNNGNTTNKNNHTEETKINSNNTTTTKDNKTLIFDKDTVSKLSNKQIKTLKNSLFTTGELQSINTFNQRAASGSSGNSKGGKKKTNGNRNNTQQWNSNWGAKTEMWCSLCEANGRNEYVCGTHNDSDCRVSGKGKGKGKGKGGGGRGSSNANANATSAPDWSLF